MQTQTNTTLIKMWNSVLWKIFASILTNNYKYGLTSLWLSINIYLGSFLQNRRMSTFSWNIQFSLFSLWFRKTLSVCKVCSSPVSIKSFCSQSAQRVVLWLKGPVSWLLPVLPSRLKAPNPSNVLERRVRHFNSYSKDKKKKILFTCQKFFMDNIRSSILTIENGIWDW